MNNLNNKTFKVLSMGCKVNYYECEAISNLLTNKGLFADENNPDVTIVNTCTVTEEGSRKTKQMIRKMKKLYPNTILVVLGCLTQVDETIKDIDGVDIILGVNNKMSIYDKLVEFSANHKQIISLDQTDKLDYENYSVSKFNSHTRAFLKVEDGCNNFCSYCIIPYARGRSRSKPFDSVISEAKELVKNGHKEIVITGIDTGYYGKDINSSLYDLLKELCNIDGLLRIRISSIEITQVDDKIINLIKDNSKIAKHLHIPIQSGSNRILKLMNRHYDKEYFIDKVNYIKSLIPDITLTTDLISGFPTENEADFNETLDTLNKINFDTIHCFPYSLRKGTLASKMEMVDMRIRKDRSLKILSISKNNYHAFVNRNINKELDVIFETYKDGYCFGHTGNYILVKMKGDISYLNKLYKIKIINNENDIMTCTLVK